MQKTIIAALVAMLTLTLATPLGHAGHGCNGAVTAVDTGAETLYLDDRSSGAGEINHWFYLESNGEVDLQTGGDNVIFENGPLGTFSDPCSHDNPDTLIL